MYFQPFDSLLERVYITMLDLDSAVADVERGLQVLDRGLDTMETDVHNGRLQLYGTGKVTHRTAVFSGFCVAIIIVIIFFYYT